MTRPVTRGLAAGLLALTSVAGAGCTVEETLRLPRCDSSSSAVLIVAQSVPTASLLVCFEPIPTGWTVSTVNIGNDGTVAVFDSDRAGASAARFRYEESCDVRAATSTPTEFDQTDRYEWIIEIEPRFKANRYYQFEGGCVTWEFDFNADAPAAMAVELGSSLVFVDRVQVNADMRRDFVDADL